jgi:hypothetical protein
MVSSGRRFVSLECHDETIRLKSSTISVRPRLLAQAQAEVRPPRWAKDSGGSNTVRLSQLFCGNRPSRAEMMNPDTSPADLTSAHATFLSSCALSHTSRMRIQSWAAATLVLARKPRPANPDSRSLNVWRVMAFPICGSTIRPPRKRRSPGNAVRCRSRALPAGAATNRFRKSCCNWLAIAIPTPRWSHGFARVQSRRSADALLDEIAALLNRGVGGAPWHDRHR